MFLNSIVEYVIAFMTLYSCIFFILLFLQKRKELEEEAGSAYWRPTISVIIPAYNEEKTIARTINSVLSSLYPLEKLEIIVINDGSKDKTLEVIKPYAAKGVRIIDKPNSGKADSMNCGIKDAKGELIATLDADSYIEPDSLLKIIA
ncbi:MAG: glycosyltransferase family 2 protein, partial [Candidatus Micrarchaeota archaeon]